MSVVGGYGFDGGYGGYNYGAPSYNPPPGAWPGQPSFMNGHSGFGGGPFMQAPNGYGAPQMGGYLGMQGLNIPAGAMYNGRPINSSNANSVFGSNTAARQSQQSASHPAPPQKSSTNGYPQSYNQGNTPTYAQQPYVVPQPRGAAQQQTQQRSMQQTPQRAVQQHPHPLHQQPPQPQQKPHQQQQQRPQQQQPQPVVRQQQQHKQQPMMQREAPAPQRQQPPPPQQPPSLAPLAANARQAQELPQHRRAQQPTSYAPPARDRPLYQPEREMPSEVPPAGDRRMSASAQAALAAASSTASSAAAAPLSNSTYSTGIKLREIKGMGLQVVRLTQGSSAMLSGQITAGDMLTRIQNHKITPYGYNLTEIRDLLAGARGSRITLGFTNNYGNAYEVDLVRNVRSTKKPASSCGSQRGPRPASWQVHGDNLGPPPLYEGLQGGSLAGGSVVDADSFTPSIAIGDMGEDEL